MKNYSLNDDIVAIATPEGSGAIGIVRLSGINVFEIASKITLKNVLNWKSHTAHLSKVYSENKVLDELLVLKFDEPKTYTGENIIEFNAHGSPFILNKIVEECIKFGARAAQPGEFTLRAFLNKKIDLSQAEAVSDLINSENFAMQQAAINHLKGDIKNSIFKLKNQLVQFASLIELELDFGEEDVEFANRKELLIQLELIIFNIQKMLSGFSQGNALKKGIPVVITGKPNVGKSSLLNCLLMENRAIVSEIAGTTRDTIEEVFNINQIPFRLIDTAGLRQTDDKIEQIGVEKALEKIEQADIIIHLFEANNFNLSELNETLQNFPKNKKVIVCANKIDVLNNEAELPQNVIPISAKDNYNIDKLKQELTVDIEKVIKNNEILLTNARHFESFSKSLDFLNKTKNGISNNLQTDMLAEDLKMAIYHLEEVTGEVSNDDILTSIFSQFCIGK